MNPAILSQIKNLPQEEVHELLDLIDELNEAKHREDARKDFMAFVKYVWPDFIEGSHHRIMADAFNDVANGKLKRLIINMPPRHTKSQFASRLLPAWFLGRYPKKKVIQASHTAELAVDFGRQVRDLIRDEEAYHRVFPKVNLKADTTAAGRWNTNKGGEYYAVGVGGNIAGRGADLFVIDDPHSEQEAKLKDPTVYDSVMTWYQTGPRQRLQPGGAIVIVMTRWNKRDLTGQLIKRSVEKEGEEWKIIELPALLPSGKALWPGYWSQEALEQTRKDLDSFFWEAQYQQNPISEEAAIVKRDWWKIWPDSARPPACNYVIQAWDTAFTVKTTADFSACVTMGVFLNEQTDTHDLILLDAYEERIEFPDLKKKALHLHSLYEPDSFIVEAKNTGAALIQELRSMGILVSDFTPVRGTRIQRNDKISRMNAIADVFREGRVWAPDTRWANKLIEQVAGFPGGADHDDLADAMVMCVTRFREGGFISLKSDETWGVERKPKRFRKFHYY